MYPKGRTRMILAAIPSLLRLSLKKSENRRHRDFVPRQICSMAFATDPDPPVRQLTGASAATSGGGIRSDETQAKLGSDDKTTDTEFEMPQVMPACWLSVCSWPCEP